MGSCVDVHFSSLGIHLSGVTGTRYLPRLSFAELPARLLPIPTAMQGAPVSHCSPCFPYPSVWLTAVHWNLGWVE